MGAYSNSPLVSYANLSPHHAIGRQHAIDTITVHCYVGQVTAKRGCDYFATTKKLASANYVVGFDGSIALSVEEKNRAYTSGDDITSGKGHPISVNGITGAMNDHRAVTIEVACDTKPPYAVTDEAYYALIRLLADICKRNNIKQLLWKADKTLVGKPAQQNMTVHRWFAQKACPGEYLYSRMGDIAEKVNAILIPKEGDDEDMQPRYNTVSELPSYAKPTIEKLISKGILKGGENGLDLSLDMVRMFVINDRAGLYD